MLYLPTTVLYFPYSTPCSSMENKVVFSLISPTQKTNNVTYCIAQFKLDIFTHVLVQLLEKFVSELASFSQVHELWHAFNHHTV